MTTTSNLTAVVPEMRKSGARWFRTPAAIAFAMGIIGILMGLTMTFVGGAEQGWFACCAVLLTGGIFLPRWWCRVSALLLIGLCVFVIQNSKDRRRAQDRERFRYQKQMMKLEAHGVSQ